MAQDVDVVVIGLGPGGESVATELAKAGLDVIGVDKHLVGGECPYYGCVPSKMMIRGADVLAEARRVGDLAGAATVSADWSPVATRIAEEATDNWDDKVAVDRLVDNGVAFVRGHGRLSGPQTVEVGGQTFRARRGVVLNTGTEPAVPAVPGLADTPYWTNRDAVQVTDLPGSLVVIGGGAIGHNVGDLVTDPGLYRRRLVVEPAEAVAERLRDVAGQRSEKPNYLPDRGADRVLRLHERRSDGSERGLQRVPHGLARGLHQIECAGHDVAEFGDVACECNAHLDQSEGPSPRFRLPAFAEQVRPQGSGKRKAR